MLGPALVGLCVLATIARGDTVQYAYDEAGRLVGAHYDDGSTITYLYDAAGNLLRRTVATFTDSDGNGLDDDWEMLHFEMIGIDLEGDADGDGQGNLREFLAGTEPHDPGDFLRVTELTSDDAEAGFTIEWSAVPGRIYRVQYNDTLLPHDWLDLPGDVVADDPIASRTDNTAAGLSRRFYRATVIQ